jgi:hypothetical protein
MSLISFYGQSSFIGHLLAMFYFGAPLMGYKSYMQFHLFMITITSLQQ